MKTYTGQHISVRGTIEVNVEYGEQAKNLHLYVVDGSGSTLFGRDWLSQIRLDWATIAKVTTQDPTAVWKPVIEKHAAVFSEKLGTISPFKATLQLRPEASPIFRKPRSVPYALKQAVETELDRLEADGIIKKVPYSEWAAPIVVVPKKDGIIRKTEGFDCAATTK